MTSQVPNNITEIIFIYDQKSNENKIDSSAFPAPQGSGLGHIVNPHCHIKRQ